MIDIYHSVIQRLKSIGYETITESNESSIHFFIDRETRYILSLVNRVGKLPEDLQYMLVDRVTGFFLRELVNNGTITPDGFSNLPDIVHSHTEGDRSITFAVEESKASKASQFTSFIDSLISIDYQLIAMHRCLYKTRFDE